jgi:asparagine synthetase B (glutamine-hydrolysing)
MCGFVTLLATSGQRVRASVLRRMTARLAHRGPDDIGFACIDPSTGASPPRGTSRW